ncbi:MAG: response regulator transcription factor [Pseudomonadales bacterium]|nr:response regulator transcription factor [Pseudomonadales bacterium]
MRILLAEDDVMIGESICRALKLNNFTVDWTRDGVATDLALNQKIHSLLLLDLGLPRMNGMDILKSLRVRSDPVPVLILTARDAVEDRIGGLNEGADDYLVKPFHLDELIARMHALLRRNTVVSDSEIIYGDIALNVLKHEVYFKGNLIELTPREFGILYALIENPGNIVSREKIEERLYGWGDEIQSNTVGVYIHHLRKKLGENIIRNIRGVGYKMGNE